MTMMASEKSQATGRMVDVQVSGLTGHALNWAVFCAIYKGMQPAINVAEAGSHTMPGAMKPLQFPRHVSLSYTGAYGIECRWNPQGDWEQGGPLIARQQISLEWDGADGKALWWKATHQEIVQFQMGETPLIAACRAVVSAHLGEVVSVPAELVEQINA